MVAWNCAAWEGKSNRGGENEGKLDVDAEIRFFLHVRFGDCKNVAESDFRRMRYSR